MRNPHKHAELIKAWADGAEIECWHPVAAEWISYEDGQQPTWSPDCKYRRKPEREFPVTNMSDDEILRIWYATRDSPVDIFRRIANAAIRRYIEDTEK